MYIEGVVNGEDTCLEDIVHKIYPPDRIQSYAIEEDVHQCNDPRCIPCNIFNDVCGTDWKGEKLQLPQRGKIEEVTEFEYTLETRLVGNNMYYQVNRPNTEWPFTTVVYNFNQEGHLNFFTNLHNSGGWGVTRGDYDFMAHCWETLGMEGKYDYETLIAARIKTFYPSEDNPLPSMEPRVWRRDINSVVVGTFDKQIY